MRIVILTIALVIAPLSAQAIPIYIDLVADATPTPPQGSNNQYSALQYSVGGLTATLTADSPYTGTDNIFAYSPACCSPPVELGVAGTSGSGAAFTVQFGEALVLALSEPVALISTNFGRNGANAIITGSGTNLLRFEGGVNAQFTLQGVSVERLNRVAVLEPATVTLLGAGLLGLSTLGRRRRKRSPG